jgi:uncharacterized membrane protein
VTTPAGPIAGPSDRRVELLIGRVLQAGVLVAAVVIITGVALMLARGGGGAPPSAFHVFHGVSPLASVRGIVQGALVRDGRAVVALGLVLLVATPVARVALTLVAFVLQRDRLYVGLTAVVLALLLYGLASGG